jgi:hypothetical protein
MPRDRASKIKIQPVRKEKPDIRALARVLIELALSEASEAVEQSEAPAASTSDTPHTGIEPAA